MSKQIRSENSKRDMGWVDQLVQLGGRQVYEVRDLGFGDQCCWLRSGDTKGHLNWKIIQCNIL